MGRIKFDSDLLKLISLFESVSGAKIKDCIMGDRITFIAEENEMGRAIGKNGANIKKLEFKLNKKVKVIEFSSSVEQFVRNLLYPIEVAGIRNESGLITVACRDSNSRAMVIGRERQNINHLAEIVKRYFDIKEIKVA